MRKATITLQLEHKKLKAIQFYIGKKDSTLEAELEKTIQTLYEKYVPPQTREYIESVEDLGERPRPRPNRQERKPEIHEEVHHDGF